MSHVTKVTVTTSQQVSITHPVQQLVITNGLPSWLYIRVGGSDLPNAQSADITVAPMSAGSFAVVPTRNFGIAVGDVTVLATTNVPITQAVCMFYETPVPVTLGQVPLSPGGFRYRQTLHDAQVLSSLSTWSVDLSNFTHARYVVSGAVVAGNAWQISAQSISVDPSLPSQLALTQPSNQGGVRMIEFPAGCVLRLQLFANVSVTITDQVEAW